MDLLNKKRFLLILIGIGVIVVFLISLFIGKYPLSLSSLLTGETLALRVFFNLRLPRVLVGLLAGFSLGIAGMIFQTIFTNPLASPDIIGVSSGASAGAAFAILFLGNTPLYVTSLAFVGSLAAVVLTLFLSSFSKNKSHVSIVLSGVAIHSLAQTILMFLKLTADPEKELASIEYWIMGGLNSITISDVPFLLVVCALCSSVLFLLYRHVLLLSVQEEEAALLGVDVKKMRALILMFATLIVASVVSVTGIISFVGLIAPHCARLMMKHNKASTLLVSGCFGGVLLMIADVLARSVAASELPVSIFTSLIGAPFLIYLLTKKGEVR